MVYVQVSNVPWIVRIPFYQADAKSNGPKQGLNSTRRVEHQTPVSRHPQDVSLGDEGWRKQHWGRADSASFRRSSTSIFKAKAQGRQ